MNDDHARILVVDDEDLVRRSLQRILEGAGYATLVAGDAAEARARLDGEPVHLVLSDVNMPGTSGIDLAHAVTRDHVDTAVVMVTAVDDTQIAETALELGAYGYVIKPFERNEILITVANALRRRALEIENRHHRERLEELVVARTASLRDALRDLGRTERALWAAHEESIQRLAQAAEFRDPYTGLHLRQMSRYCELLALRLGFDDEHAELLRLASPMHDVGKIGVHDAVLLKEGPLDAGEWAEIHRHPEIGHDILAGSDAPVLQLAAEVALFHHEKWDGSGYPNGIAGEGIPVEARVVAVADVFDALTSERPYKEAFELDRAVQIMKEGRGTHFDADILDVFLAHLDEMVQGVAHADEETADTGELLEVALTR